MCSFSSNSKKSPTYWKGWTKDAKALKDQLTLPAFSSKLEVTREPLPLWAQNAQNSYSKQTCSIVELACMSWIKGKRREKFRHNAICILYKWMLQRTLSENYNATANRNPFNSKVRSLKKNLSIWELWHMLPYTIVVPQKFQRAELHGFSDSQFQ